MHIAQIINSNSHVDYVARVIDKMDSNNPPSSEDYGFAQFVSLKVSDETSICGIIYDSILINPEYSNFGPRLSPKTELASFSPDYLNEQGILLGILLLGSLENGKSVQELPRRIISAGQKVEKMSESEVKSFHADESGSLQIHYYSQVIAHTALFGIPLVEAILDQLTKIASNEDSQRLSVLKNSLVWQRTVGGMRL
jgi:hypothetical protein